jgi:hypothetical protein
LILEIAVSTPIVGDTPLALRVYRAAPAVVGTGLGVLLIALAWPTAPAITGMSLVALGATAATIERFRGLPALVPILFAHAAIYGGLYALFIGAVLSSRTAAAGHLGWLAAIDLAVSSVPIAGAVALIASGVRASFMAQ